MGRISKVENKYFARFAIRIWQLFSDDMRLHEAEKSNFNSIHECFTRRLKHDARPLEQDDKLLVSPCDAVIGAHGNIRNLEALQIKGMPYSLQDLTQGAVDLEPYRDGKFITLRLKSSMYHHMHAPVEGRCQKLHYISGDTWNVNPPTLKRVGKLFCRNERALIELKPLDSNAHLLMVPVAAVLVASMRFDGLDYPLSLSYKGPNEIEHLRSFKRGEHMGHFEHGSTIVLLTSKHFSFMPLIKEGLIIRMGQALMRPNQINHQQQKGSSL
jgi:phosphatidylserine decarboxylase